jgi:hypothetical protein
VFVPEVEGAKMIDFGFILALLGTCISLYGMYLNNQKHDHHGAMMMWFYSNPILMVYFVGQSFDLWNGGLSAAVMAGLYAVFTVSNWRGLA